MAAKKHDLKNILKRPMTTKDVTTLWSNEFSSDFKPDYERLMRRHKVPTINKSFLDEGNW